MPTVKSADGTPIAYTKTGSGPPLVLVHGISADAARWAPVMPGLEALYTVYAMDRRGRGESGDSSAYGLEREFDDVAALVEAVGAPVFLFGHSYGGLCTLYGALLTSRVRKLVVYEPYVPVVAASEASATTLRYEALAASGERDAVVTTFLREIVQLSEKEVALMRAHPSWAARLAAAHTIPRELRAAEQFHFQRARFADLRIAVTMFVGANSPEFLKDATSRIHAALPTSEVRVLEGQRHAAMNTAPSLFVQALHDVLSS
jgi:pimeloyl-ACP methyl ester carboxylesterase